MAMHINAKITRTSCEKSKEKGTPSVCLWLELTGDKYGFLPEGVEKKQYANLWLTQATVEKTKETLRELGFEGHDLLELHYSNPLEGKECSITGDFETDSQGNRRFRVQWVNTGDRKPKDIGDGNEFKAFNKFFADGGKKPEQKPQTKTQEADDDLPF